MQKEEELARLHEENNHLRQYLNSALVKCLEEKAKVCTSPFYKDRVDISLFEKGEHLDKTPLNGGSVPNVPSNAFIGWMDFSNQHTALSEEFLCIISWKHLDYIF